MSSHPPSFLPQTSVARVLCRILLLLITLDSKSGGTDAYSKGEDGVYESIPPLVMAVFLVNNA